MSSRGDRARAWAEMMRSRMFSCGCLAIRPTQYLDIRVRDGGRNNARVDRVLIGIYPAFPLPQPHPLPIAPLFQDWTDELGDLIHRLPAGQYHVRARKDWHAPDDDWVYNVNLGARDNRIVRFNMHRVMFYLHVDADRDGAVDDWPESIDQAAPAWAWGANGRGAIIPVNVDNDNTNANNAGDQEDDVINGINDQDSDIARLEVRRHGGNNAIPPNWRAELEILSPANEARPETRARIFDGVAVGAQRLLGSGVARSPLPGWPVNADAYGMEATHYAGRHFNGILAVRLTVTRPNGFGGHTSYMSEAQVRAASWLMPNHLDRADTVYVSRIAGDADSTAFINALTPLVQRPDNQGGAGAQLEPRDYDDQWMQDCMEIGYSTWPGTGGGTLRMESVMRALRGRSLRNMPKTLRGVNFGYTFPGTGGQTTYDATGNLEVTPPVDATANAADNAGPKRYPWGRIYYGHGRPRARFNRATRMFLEHQVVQKPIPLNTDWLAVGHVDEMMSFIPSSGGNKPWKLLIASPTRAYAILDAINGAGGGATPVMQRAPNALQLDAGQYIGTVPGDYWDRRATNVATTVATMLGGGNSPIADPEDYPLAAPAYNNEGHATRFLTWAEIRTWNEVRVQGVIDDILDVLEDEIDLDRNLDVIEVPVIFMPDDHLYNPHINTALGQHPLTIEPGRPGGYVAGALTGDMVNMLVANRMLVVPMAFGPATADGDAFQTYLSDQITAANNYLRVRYVDDWNLYHARMGEVHCGTNTLRKPAPGNDMTDWLASDAAKWWDFPG